MVKLGDWKVLINGRTYLVGQSLKKYRTRGRMPAEIDSPLVGRNNIGRWSSVHAVRARPLQNVKNNIEPDEHREEADTPPHEGC